MHKFNNSWLFKREKIDNLSKNKLIIQNINKSLKSHNEINIIDLGTGTGSNFRYLSKKIKYNNQYWTLMDISKSSLKEARANTQINRKINNFCINIFKVKTFKPFLWHDIQKCRTCNYIIVTKISCAYILYNIMVFNRNPFNFFVNFSINSCLFKGAF